MTAPSAEDFERATSWNLTIANELLGTDTPCRDEGLERKWGSFSICRATGSWYDFAASVGGVSPIALVQRLKQRAGEEWGFDDAVAWLLKFLAANPGTGQLEAEDGEETQTRQAAVAALARHYLAIAEPLPQDGAEVAYLTGRGIFGPYPEALRRVPNARPGESALLMPLIASGRVTGVLMTHIDAIGRRSLAGPARRRLDLERAPGAVLVIQESAPGVVDISATMIVAEGLENAMSVAHPEVKHPGWKIIGVPGISTLKNVPVKVGDRVIVFQDSDPEDHPAQLGLQAGIDSLILQGAQVRRTERHNDGDANAILQARGPAELRRLLARPAGAPLKFESEKLSIDGEIVRLAKLSPAEYEKERKQVARESAWRVGALDKAVARLRPEPAEAEDGSAKSTISLPVDTPWAGPAPQLAPLLDRITAEVRRYVIMQDWQAHLVSVWLALSYFVFDQRIDLQVMPRLAIQSAVFNSGKTALLRIVTTLSRHGKLYGRATSAGIYRALSQAELTLCLDEVEFLRADPFSPMMQVLDSSHHREDANILLTEPQKFGPPIARELSTWAAMALACNGQLPGSLQSRSIVVVLLRALADEKHEFLERRSTPELVDLRRELTAWAATITELPFPSRGELPDEVYNRAADNWRPMYAIARLAGDVWFERIKQASLKASKTETLPPLIVTLLASVKRAFGDNPKPNTWLDTTELVARLIAQEGEPWGKVNRGGPIDPYWLRTKFLGLLDPPGAQGRWETVKGDRSKQKHHRGYYYGQFTDAIRRLPEPAEGVFDPDKTHTETGPKTAGVSGVSRAKPPKPRETAIPDTPDSPVVSGVDQEYEKPSKSADDEPISPVTPDTPADLPPSSVCVPELDEFVLARGPQPPDAEPASAAKPAKVAENLDPEPPKKARPPARPRKAKPNGPAAQLDLPAPPPAEYSAGSIAEEIRQLRAANPKRSIKWIAQRSGQPASAVREILGDGVGLS
jgi:hypothetical protein